MNIDLTIHTGLARKILTGFIRSEITRAGFSRALVGLSGGLDSAVSCALAAEALGSKNVLAVRLPYRTSSPDSLEDARLVATQLGVMLETIEITDMVEPLLRRDAKISNVRRGNILARARMIVLYDQSRSSRAWWLGPATRPRSSWDTPHYGATWLRQ